MQQYAEPLKGLAQQIVGIASGMVIGVLQFVFIWNMAWSLKAGKKAPGNPWEATTLEWQTPDTPPCHGNWRDELPVVYRWAYDYSVPGAKEDFIPQNHPVTEEEQTGGEHQEGSA